MKSKNKESYRIFPFAPGVPWKLKHGKYIIPDMSLAVWQGILKDKTVVVSAFGGLIESFLSMSILEVINFSSPQSSLLWSGKNKYTELMKFNGLASYYSSLDQTTLLRFPTPVFLDKIDKIYFNCLNNYLKVYSYYGDFGYLDRRNIVSQIFEKSLVPWNLDFLPKMRNLSQPIELASWAKTHKFNASRPYVLIIPDRTEHTQHNQCGLNWTPVQVKAFGTMLNQSGISLIVMSDEMKKYQDAQLYTLPLKLDYFFYFLPSAFGILSQDVDFLILANILSQAHIISRPFSKELKLNKINKLLENKNTMHLSKDIKPLEAYNYLTGTI